MKGLSRSDILSLIQNLSPDERETFFAYLRELDKRMYWQLHPEKWMEEVLEIDIKSIIWSQNPGYLEKGYVDETGEAIPEKWDGTPDPIYAILRALAHWKDVAVESGTGLGKTYVAAAILLWFLAVHPEAQVYTVAPKAKQLETGVWKEVGRMWPKFHKHYPDAEKLSLHIRMDPEGPFRDSWFATGLTAGVGAEEDSATKAQGLHAEHMLFIIEESVGVPMPIIEAIENTCTDPHNLRLFIGNPSSTIDPLHQMFVRPEFTSIRISGYDHPNIVYNAKNHPSSEDPEVGAVEEWTMVLPYYSWKTILGRRQKYGPEPDYYNNHPLYKSRVRGICPSGSTFSIFTNKTLDLVDQRLSILEKNTGKPYQAIEEHEWSIQNLPPLAKVWKIAPDPRIEGFTRIYRKPKNTHLNRYIIFGDVADDIGDGDYHAGVVLDRKNMMPVALVHMRGPREYYAAELVRVGQMFGAYEWESDIWHYPVLCWERNAGGALHLIPEFMSYPNKYIHRPTDTPKKKLRNAWGWYTTAKNRPEMTGSLEEWGIKYVRNIPERIPDIAFLEEMRSFEWNVQKRRYEARGGTHDDIMMALAGALTLHKILPPMIPLAEEPPAHIREHWMERKRLMQKELSRVRHNRRTTANAFDKVKLPSMLGRRSKRG